METRQRGTGMVKRDRKRVEAVVEALTDLQGEGESVADLAHDARNMVTALVLYCELLDEPGVLAPKFLHYAQELRLVTAASRRLVEKLLLLDTQALSARATGAPHTRKRFPVPPQVRALPGTQSETGLHTALAGDRLPNDPIDDLQNELLANSHLLDAMAGTGVAVKVTAEGGAWPVRLNSEDLTRVLVNLVKNATESMRGCGTIDIHLQEILAGEGTSSYLLMRVEDSGPGIPASMLETVFEAGYTTRSRSESRKGWPVMHRGLGLSISRSIIEAAGGRISVCSGANRGACFSIELPPHNP